MEQENYFFKGMNKDISKKLMPKDSYRNGRNLRIATDGLDSSSAIVNIDGNAILTSIPSVSNILQLQITGVFPLAVSFSINSVVVSGTVNSYQDIADLINNDATLSSSAYNIKAASSLTQVLIWSALDTNNLTTILNVTNAGVNTGVTITQLIASQTGLKVCGWGLVRDDIILFTTNSSDRNPGGHDTKNLTIDASSVGQIWRLTYDVVTLVPTLTLLYNNYVDFTTYFSFREEGQSEGRYENSSTKNIYWTDNFNTLRRFNIVDQNGFALDVSLLDCKANIDSTVPILQKINDSGGIISAGVWQTAYRLKNNGGATTIFSKCSNIVSVINGIPDSTPFKDYVSNTGPFPSGSGHSITWQVDNLDTDYERIEIVVLFRPTRTSVPTIDIVYDEPMPVSGSFKYTYTGNEIHTPVSLNDFLDTGDSFTHCKTITSKDNLLIAANVRNETFDIDFDARAYRFTSIANGGPLSRNTRLEDTQGNPIIITSQDVINNPTTWGTVVPEEHDCINKNTSVSPIIDQYDQTQNGYRFQSDGVTLGGEGPNIKYTFKIDYFQSDQFTSGNGFSGSSLDITVGPVGQNARVAPNQPANFPLNNNTFANNNFYDGFKSPYISSAFKGYHPDETYAFAIVFYDKKGRAGFSKWIADIRMPLIYEDDGTGTGNSFEFKHTDLNGYSNWQRVGILVPEFNVTIPTTISDKISSWNIVRCERTASDKTILASGILNQGTYDSGTGTFYTIAGNFLDTYGIVGTSTTNGSALLEVYEGEVATITSPEFLLSHFPGYNAGDKLKIACILDITHFASSTNPAPPDEIRLHKYYTISPVIFPDSGNAGRTNIRSLDYAVEVSSGGTETSGISSGSKIIENATAGYFSTIFSGSKAVSGQRTTFMEWKNASSLWFGPGMPGGGNSRYYCFYTRTVTNQYGGNSYSQRANREYISCGQFQQITVNFPAQSNYTVKIFGGDIFTTVFDVQNYIASQATVNYEPSIVQWFPVHTGRNTEWRFGNSINRAGIVSHTPDTPSEDFNDLPVFSAEDNTQKYFPKPVNFIDVQENDNRIHASAFKINGESTDSWGIFPPLDFKDADGQYGPINNLQVLKGNVFGLQDKGVFYVPINEKVTIPDNAASRLVLGVGNKLARPTYLTTSSGCRHQFGNITTDQGLYYFDIDNLKLNRITNTTEEVSVIGGMDSFFKTQLNGDIRETDKPNYSYGIIATHDQNNHDVLFTFHDSSIINPTQSLPRKTSETLAYNEIYQCFTFFYDFFPKLYISDKTHIITPNSTPSDLYMHSIGNPGEFYGTTFDSTISLIIAPPGKEIVFDSFEYISELKDLTGVNITDESWNSIRVHNDYQNSDYNTLTVGTNLKRKKRTWNLTVPRDIVKPNVTNPDIFLPANLDATQLFKPRIRSQFINVDLTYINGANGNYRKLIMPSWKTLYRISDR